MDAEMGLTLFLSSLPLWVNAILLVVLTTFVAMCGPLVVRRTVGLEQLTANNEVAGFKFAVLGVIYAVLLGFAVIVVWEKFRDADAAVAQEASGIVSVYRLSLGIDPAVGAVLRKGLDDYVHVAVSEDWPAMAQGRKSPATGRALSALYAAAVSFDARTPREGAILNDMLTQLDTVTQGRRARLLLVTGVMPTVLWAVLFFGAFVTLSFTFFFGSRSLRAQVLMTGMLAATIFMALFVVVEIDHPFAGPVSVSPEALENALDVRGQ
jgi:hypothetical protein